MGLLNEQGDRLARRVQRGLVRAGLNDVSTLAVQPAEGRQIVLRHGLALHRVLIQPYHAAGDASSDAPGWMRLFVAREFDDDTAWRMADAGISYLDELGNAQLVLDGQTILFARAERPQRSAVGVAGERGSRPPKQRAALSLGRSGHQVAFALLCKPELADAPIRALAAAAGVSLGTAHSTLKDLADAGFLADGRLRRAGHLLDVWADAYRRISFPSLTPRPLYAPGWEWAEQARLDPATDVLVGGAAAAGMLTGQLRATDGLAYVREAGPAVRLLRLAPTPTPFRVDLRERFWGDDLPAALPGLVPSVLVHGDLLRDGDDRSLETAHYLREHDAHLRALD